MAGFVPTDKIGGLTESETLAFITHPWNARIATITQDGWPHITPVWYEFDQDARRFLIVGRERALWVGHVRDNPRIAFHVADDVHAQHTRVLIQATAEIVEGPVAPRQSPRILDLTHRLSRRYLGPDGPSYAERTIDRPRVLVALTPARWTTWTGGEWHPRYR
ncbi:MAG TPA: pyridoxamine 5'-phosphate oxidase family protein [Candidatus Methylomirabilis sp.]|nr:pyridoxamine 5'-phosphate oxidase family protein [Candidatus Methylomirabilis sp.]